MAKTSRKNPGKGKRPQGPDDIRLPPATDWRTTDQDEINRRILRAREEKFVIRNLAPRHPVFSDFEVQSQSGMTYTVEIRSVARRRFNCSCVDFQVNGLGTCKHVEAVLQHLGATRKKDFAAARTKDNSPRIDIIADPAASMLVVERGFAALPAPARAHFDKTGRAPVNNSAGLDDLLAQCAKTAAAAAPALRISQTVPAWREKLRREETRRALRRDYEQKVRSGEYPPHETLVPLYPYQREGMLHLAFGERALLADEMGLGKTIQAIAACALLRRLGQARRVLVVTPASLKAEWEEQIRRFTPLPLQTVFGGRRARLAAYENAPFFTLVNYEQMRSDALDVNARLRPDIIVLDEAQRIKNWASKTAQAVKRLQSPRAFVLTGTPIENRLDELYSLVSFLDPAIFGPLFRFNREFYDLDERGRPEYCRSLARVHERIRPLLLRRRKSDVETELPDRTDRNLFIALADTQRADYETHKTIVAKLAAIAKRRPLTKQEQEKLLLEMGIMRMLCDTPYILDKSPDPDRTCPKLDELTRILDELLDENETLPAPGAPGANAPAPVKIIIFSEWVRMLELVRDHLRQKRIGCAWHTGGVPQQKRRAEIRLFKDDPECRVFLSTDSGGVGLNLQNASVVINCDLPWNPAKLEQRIARAWRKHQKNAVTVINLIAENTIEHGMLGTLAAKQSLAEGVLDLRGDLEHIPLRPAGQTFFQRLEQIMAKGAAAGKAMPRAPGEQTSGGDAAPPSDPGAEFAKAAAGLFPGRVVACEERYPSPNPEGEPLPPVLVVVVDHDAGTLRPRFEELRDKLRAPDMRVEVLDRATAQAMERLREMGLIQTTTRGTRVLYSISNDTTGPGAAAPAPLSEEEKARAAEHRKEAGKRLRLAKVFIEEDLADEARAALRAAALALAGALAVEKRVGILPKNLRDLSAPPLSYLPGGELPALARQLEDGPAAGRDAEKLRELAAALEKQARRADACAKGCDSRQ
jgi:superfamily II DNA or RNA helicase